MKCPSCANSKIVTYDTRRIEDMVVRKRKCLACSERFYTLEQYMSEDELEEVQQLKKKIEEVQEIRKKQTHDPRSESQSEGEEAA